MTRILLLLLPALAALAQSQPSRQITSQAVLMGGQHVPGFQKGYLFFLEGGAVRLYSPEGLLVLATVVQIPDSIGQPAATGLAVDRDGSVAVSAKYETSTGFGGGIVFYDRNGQPDGFVDTGRYFPGNLSFGEDHSLWAFGWQNRDALQAKRSDMQDYMMVRRYSSDRKEQGRYLPRSLFPTGVEPGLGAWQNLGIAVADDRVGLWAGKGWLLNEWVELDLNGNLIRRVMLDADHTQVVLAFTADGHLYRQIVGKPNLWHVLDRTTSEWRDAGPAPAFGFRLWGADGNSLVFSPNQPEGPIVLEWFEQP